MNLNLIYLMYGLAYFTMGLAVWVKIRPLLDNRLARVFLWLVAFGLIHAIHEWIEMFVIMGHTGSDILTVSTLIVALSFASLLQFGVEFMGLKKNLPRIIRLCPAILLFLWILFYLRALSYDEGMRLAEIWSRYILGFLGTFLTAYALTRQRKEVADSPYISRNLLWAGISFGFYGIFTIIVPEADFFPASVLNYTRFTNLIGIPVQIFRMLSAVAITYFIVKSLDVFDVFEKRKLSDRVTEMTGALEESEEKYRTLFELAGDALLAIVPPWGEIIDVNEVATQMLGYSKEEFKKLCGSDIIAPEVLEEIDNEWEKQMDEKGYFLYETIWVRKDGSHFPVEVSGRPLELRGKALFQLIGRDITERKQAEEAQRESQLELSTIFENAPELMLLVDEERRIRKVNHVAAEFADRTEEEMIGLRGGEALRCLHSLDDPKGCGFGPICQRCIVRLTVLDTFETGKSHQQVEARLLVVHGDKEEELDLLVSTTPLTVSGTEMVLVSLQDITKRKQAEKALKDSESKYRSLFESANDAIIIFEPQNEIILEANSKISDIYGFSHDEFVGMSLKKISKEVTSGEERIRQVIRKGTIDNFKTVHIKKDGTPINILVNASTIEYEGQLAILSINRDITEHVQAEEALKQSEEKYRVLSGQLMEANNMKELLLDVITHDLKNPAGVISGLADMMVDEFPDNEIVEVIKDSSNSLLQVVESATLLSQVAFGEEIQKEEIDLEEVIKKVVNQFSLILKNVGMSLENHVSETLIIKANPIIEEVFKNYISNAIKYASEGKRIVIEAFKDNEFVTIGVKDFGQSISKSDYQRIFVRSMRLEKDAKRGRGLGLAIVKRIAEAYNGEVWVSERTIGEANRKVPSDKPKGNIFYLKMPRK